MRIDIQVSRRKFELEIESLQRHSKGLRQRGCWVMRCEYPEIDVVFVPKNPLHILIPGANPAAGPGPLQVELKCVVFPFLSARAFGVRIGMDDYDQRAPSVSFKDPWTWEPLTYVGNPNAFNAFLTTDQGQILTIMRNHPATKLPFLCMSGTREYHEHPQHSGDDWMLYRGKMGVFGLLSNILDACIDAVIPGLNLQGAAQCLMLTKQG